MGWSKTIKRRLKFLLNPILNYLLIQDQREANQFARYYAELPVQPKTIFYESQEGQTQTGNPYALFTYLVRHPDFKHYQHIWSVQHPNHLTPGMHGFKAAKNVHFVKRGSKPYLKWLACSETVINNQTFPTYFTPKDGQTYLNTWEGTSLKSLETDHLRNPFFSKNIMRNFLNTQYLLSQNSYTTRIFKKNYKLEGLYEGGIIETGYPRVDLTLHTNPKLVVESLKQGGLTLSPSKATLLYMPTLSETDMKEDARSETSIKEVGHLLADLNHLKRELGDTYNLLLKVDPLLYEEARKSTELRSFLVPDHLDPNELLAAVDIFVTDFSNLVVDVLVTNKPILFYARDLDSHSIQRKYGVEPDTLPGPILFQCSELISSLRNLERVQMSYKAAYQTMKRQLTPYEDGHVSERISQLLFNSSNKRKPVKIESCATSKKKILIYPGGLKPNGITASAINLLNNIDYETYDVTCLSRVSTDPDVIANLKKIPSQVRLVFRPGRSLYRMGDVYKDKMIMNRGIHRPTEQRLWPEAAYQREIRRLLGNTHFDYGIDFNGYNLYWAKFLLTAKAERRLLFLHSDLLSDSERTVNGRKPHKVNLQAMFSVFHRFDKLVSVSESTMRVNQTNLSRYAAPEKFVYALNSINPERILQMAHDVTSFPLRQPAQALSLDAPETEPKPLPMPDSRHLNFVNVGRLSTEKGQATLIQAFGHFHATHPESRLFILGKGPLKDDLENVITTLGLTDSVFLLGQVDNPFYIMNQCDCFVLSSHYEGQPMVLLEALTLKMSILATDIVANRTVLEDGKYGILVQNSVEDLANGMMQIAANIDQGQENAPFDPKDYNRKAMDMFYQILDH